MKKILYVILLSLASSLSFVACTEEEIAPKKEVTGNEVGGGGESDPVEKTN